MPIYEYQCLDCNKTVDVIQKISDPPLLKCQLCGGELQKQISIPIVHTRSKTTVARQLIPDIIGRGGLDGTRPLTWPGRLLGVKKDMDNSI